MRMCMCVCMCTCVCVCVCACVVCVYVCVGVCVCVHVCIKAQKNLVESEHSFKQMNLRILQLLVGRSVH